MFEVIEQQIVDINEAIGKNNFSKALELIDLASDEILRVQPAQKDNDLMPAKIAYLQARQTLIAERGKYFNSAAIATAETALNLARTKLPFDISNSFDGLPEKEIQSCIDQLESDLANAQKINSLEEQLERFFLNLFSLSASPEQWPVLKQAVLNRLLNSLNLSSVTEEVKVREVLESRIKEENFNFYLRYIVKEAKLHTWFHDAENPERILTVIQLGSTEGYDGANVNYHSLLKLRDMLSSKTVGYFSEDYNDYNQKGKTHFQAKLYGLLLAKLGLTTRAQEYFSAIFDLAIERKDLCFIGTFLDENLVTEYGMPARTKGNFTNRLKTAIEEEFNRTIQAKEFNNAVALFLEVSQTTRGEIVYRHNFTEQEVNTLRERLISGYLEYLFSSDHEKFKATEVLSLLVGRTSSETIISNRGNKYAQVPLHETNQKDKPKITFEVTAKCVTEGVRKALYKYSTEEVITDEIPSKENNKQPEKKPLLTEQQKHNEAEEKKKAQEHAASVVKIRDYYLMHAPLGEMEASFRDRMDNKAFVYAKKILNKFRAEAGKESGSNRAAVNERIKILEEIYLEDYFYNRIQYGEWTAAEDLLDKYKSLMSLSGEVSDASSKINEKIKSLEKILTNRRLPDGFEIQKRSLQPTSPFTSVPSSSAALISTIPDVPTSSQVAVAIPPVNEESNRFKDITFKAFEDFLQKKMLTKKAEDLTFAEVDLLYAENPSWLTAFLDLLSTSDEINKAIISGSIGSLSRGLNGLFDKVRTVEETKELLFQYPFFTFLLSHKTYKEFTLVVSDPERLKKEVDGIYGTINDNEGGSLFSQFHQGKIFEWLKTFMDRVYIVIFDSTGHIRKPVFTALNTFIATKAVNSAIVEATNPVAGDIKPVVGRVDILITPDKSGIQKLSLDGLGAAIFSMIHFPINGLGLTYVQRLVTALQPQKSDTDYASLVKRYIQNTEIYEGLNSPDDLDLHKLPLMEALPIHTANPKKGERAYRETIWRRLLRELSSSIVRGIESSVNFDPLNPYRSISNMAIQEDSYAILFNNAFVQLAYFRTFSSFPDITDQTYLEEFIRTNAVSLRNELLDDIYARVLTISSIMQSAIEKPKEDVKLAIRNTLKSSIENPCSHAFTLLDQAPHLLLKGEDEYFELQDLILLTYLNLNKGQYLSELLPVAHSLEQISTALSGTSITHIYSNEERYLEESLSEFLKLKQVLTVLSGGITILGQPEKRFFSPNLQKEFLDIICCPEKLNTISGVESDKKIKLELYRFFTKPENLEYILSIDLLTSYLRKILQRTSQKKSDPFESKFEPKANIRMNDDTEMLIFLKKQLVLALENNKNLNLIFLLSMRLFQNCHHPEEVKDQERFLFDEVVFRQIDRWAEEATIESVEKIIALLNNSDKKLNKYRIFTANLKIDGKSVLVPIAHYRMQEVVNYVQNIIDKKLGLLAQEKGSDKVFNAIPQRIKSESSSTKNNTDDAIRAAFKTLNSNVKKDTPIYSTMQDFILLNYLNRRHCLGEHNLLFKGNFAYKSKSQILTNQTFVLRSLLQGISVKVEGLAGIFSSETRRFSPELQSEFLDILYNPDHLEAILKSTPDADIGFKGFKNKLYEFFVKQKNMEVFLENKDLMELIKKLIRQSYKPEQNKTNEDKEKAVFEFLKVQLKRTLSSFPINWNVVAILSKEIFAAQPKSVILNDAEVSKLFDEIVCLQIDEWSQGDASQLQKIIQIINAPIIPDSLGKRSFSVDKVFNEKLVKVSVYYTNDAALYAKDRLIEITLFAETPPKHNMPILTTEVIEFFNRAFESIATNPSMERLHKIYGFFEFRGKTIENQPVVIDSGIRNGWKAIVARIVKTWLETSGNQSLIQPHSILSSLSDDSEKFEAPKLLNNDILEKCSFLLSKFLGVQGPNDLVDMLFASHLDSLLMEKPLDMNNQEAIIQKWNELKRYADFRHGSTLTFSVFSQSFNANRAVLDKKLDVEYLMQLAQLDTVKLNRLGIWLLADQMMKKSLELMSAEETTIEFQINQPNAKRYREEAEKLYKSIFGELERNPENLIKYYNESQQKQRMKSEEEEFGSSKDPESGYSTPLPSGSSANDLTKMERSASVERRNSELARSEDGSQGLHRNAQSFSVALSKNPAGTSKAVQQNLALDTTKKQEESATASQNYERLHASIMTHKELPSQALFNRIRTGFETLELTQSDRMAVADFLVEQYSIPKRGSLFFAKPQGVQFEQIERVYLVSWDRTQDINFLLKLAKTLFDKHKSTQNLDDFKKALKYKKDYLDNAFKQELMPINDLIEFVSLVNNTSKGSYSTEINSWLTRAAEHYASEIPRNPSPGNYECLAKVRFLQSEQIPDNSSIDEKNQGMQAALEAEYQYFQAMQGDGYEIPIERFIKFARLSLNQYKNMTGSIEHGAEIDTWLEQALNTCMRMNRQEVDAVSRADNYWYSAELCFLQADRTAVGTLKDAKLGQGIKYQDDYKNAYAKISSDTLSEEKKRQHAVRLEMCDWKMRVYLNRGSTGQSSPPVLTQ